MQCLYLCFFIALCIGCDVLWITAMCTVQHLEGIHKKKMKYSLVLPLHVTKCKTTGCNTCFHHRTSLKTFKDEPEFIYEKFITLTLGVKIDSYSYLKIKQLSFSLWKNNIFKNFLVILLCIYNICHLSNSNAQWLFLSNIWPIISCFLQLQKHPSFPAVLKNIYVKHLHF